MKEKSIEIHAYVSSKMDAEIRKRMEQSGRSKSEVIRSLLRRGLKASMPEGQNEEEWRILQEALQEVLKPHVERLAAISAKGAQISAAAFFLAYQSGRLQLPEEMQMYYEEAAATARKLGIEYLKLPKGTDIDEFVEGGLHRMENSL